MRKIVCLAVLGMSLAAPACAEDFDFLGILQEDDVNPRELRADILKRQQELEGIDQRIRDASTKDDRETVKRLRQEYDERDKELRDHRARLERVETVYYGSEVLGPRAEAGVLFSRFDKDIDFEDTVGEYLKIYLPASRRYGGFIHAIYRRWNLDNDRPRTGSSTIRGYLLGITWTPEWLTEQFPRKTSIELAASGGLDRLDSTVGGSNSDTAWALDLAVTGAYRFFEFAQIKLGGDAEFVWTDFHNDDSKMIRNLALTLGLDLGF